MTQSQKRACTQPAIPGLIRNHALELLGFPEKIHERAIEQKRM
jgi:hypothetical protein